MKRLQRRVQVSNSGAVNSSSENASGTQTFDRRTFFECSNRMKRLVPTLRRRQCDVPNSDTQPSQNARRLSPHVGNDYDSPISFQNQTDISTPNWTLNESNDELTCENQRIQGTSSLLLTKGSPSNNEIEVTLREATIATLPRNKANAKGKPTVSCESATLPTLISMPISKEKASGERRRIWRKPLTSFVTFMSNIGDNIHYPAP